MAEDAVELVEIALVLDQRGAREMIEILHSEAGQTRIHRLHQGQIFLESDRDPGGLELMEEGRNMGGD